MARGANLLRIIGGQHRGRRLSFVPAPGLRPTPDRVRETLFNWLREDVAGARCLDLFAGSGALGFEALSRGAATVTAVERHRAAAQRLRDNAHLLGESDRMSVVQADALRVLLAAPETPYDIVFIDPPFADRRVAEVLEGIVQPGWLADRAVLYIEQDKEDVWEGCPSGWHVHRVSDAGQSAQRLLRRTT